MRNDTEREIGPAAHVPLPGQTTFLGSHLFARADALHLPLPDASVDLVLGSPPYVDARLYLEDGKDLGIARDQYQWVAWMLDITREALRVTRGAVIWVCAGKTEDRNYWPACEGLLWEAHKAGILSETPVYWHRNGVPGSGGSQWFRKDVEYCLAFKRTEVLAWSDNTACGHAPKWASGGECSNRLSDGSRRNQWGGSANSGRSRRRNGSRQTPGRPSHRIPTPGYASPDISNPGNAVVTAEDAFNAEREAVSSFVRTLTGGGHMGHAIAHENEAPFPEDLAEFFLRSLCPPNGLVLDPFSGSGTTVAVAERLDRRGIGLDLRMSQCRLGTVRVERPHKPVVKASKADAEPRPLFSQLGDVV
ncbi:site-specific DNA-methyltransferase [Paludisphaera rhizosphaerae]|uniref:site-specific DNA-methyltransferase n=1 Tax=Paludisphaera rhizosphaerae TaxID=2711216 RepID=UPI0013EB3896|nr:site-specific DNA-methyltransferase [Paludisphaera rhizosphaerae]